MLERTNSSPGLVPGNLLVVDPGRISCEALRLLMMTMGFSVAGAGVTVSDALQECSSDRCPDLVIHNIGSDAELELALSMIKETRARLERAKSVVLMDCARVSTVAMIMRAGVEAVLSKDISIVVLQRSLELVVLGQRMFPADATAALLESATQVEAGSPEVSACAIPLAAVIHAAVGRRPTLLSGREYQILRCLVDGMPNKLIARELDIAEATVKVHIKGVLRKTHLANRTQAAIWALNNSVSAALPPAEHAEPPPATSEAVESSISDVASTARSERLSDLLAGGVLPQLGADCVASALPRRHAAEQAGRNNLETRVVLR